MHGSVEAIDVATLLGAGSGQSLLEILTQIERLLESESQLIHQSLQAPATTGQMKEVASAAGLEGSLPADLVTWWQWHDGQTPDPHRTLAPDHNTYYLLSALESAALICESKKGSSHIEGWIPLIGLPSNEACWALGLHTCGPHAGKLSKGRHEEQPCFDSMKHLAASILAKFRDALRRLPPEQYWVHGVAAILVEANNFYHTLPGGLWPRADAQSATRILFEYWDIRSPSDLRNTMAGLESVEDAPGELAFNLGRASALAGFGRAAGWLSIEESWGVQLRAARRVQTAYTSWREFARSYAASLLSSMDIDEDPSIERIFADPTSPFHLPWDTALSETPAPDLPALRVKVSPDQHDEFNLLVTRHHSPRILEVELEAGSYVLDQMVVQPCCLLGASIDGTVIHGMNGQRAAVWTEYNALELQDLTIRYDQVDAKLNALQATASTLLVRRCRIEGQRYGALFNRGGWALLEDCEIIGKEKRGLCVDSVVHVQGGSIKGHDVAVILQTSGALYASSCQIEGLQEGLRTDGGAVHLRDTEVIGVHDYAVYVTGSTILNAHGCRVRSVESTAISTSSDNDVGSPAKLELEQTTLGPSKLSMAIRAGATASLHECDVRSPFSAQGGSVLAVDSKFHALVRATKGSEVDLFDCQIDTGDVLSMYAGAFGVIRTSDCSISTGVLAHDGGALLLRGGTVRGSEELPAVDVANGRISLRTCKVIQEASAQCVAVKDGTLSAVDCELTTTHQSIAAVTPQGIAHFWRCRFESRRADSLQLQNGGRVHVHNCSFISQGWCLHGQEGSTTFVDQCKADCPNNPLSRVEGANIIEDRIDLSDAVQLTAARELTVRYDRFSDAVAALVALPDAARQLVVASLALAAPTLALTVIDAESGLLQILSSEDLRPETVGYVARCVSQPETATAVLWTVDQDREE